LINQKGIQTIRELLKKGIEADEEEDKLYGEKRGDEIPTELLSCTKVHEIIKKVRKPNSDGKNGNKLRKTSSKLLEQASQNHEQKKFGIKKIRTRRK
jgi:transposase